MTQSLQHEVGEGICEKCGKNGNSGEDQTTKDGPVYPRLQILLPWIYNFQVGHMKKLRTSKDNSLNSEKDDVAFLGREGSALKSSMVRDALVVRQIAPQVYSSVGRDASGNLLTDTPDVDDILINADRQPCAGLESNGQVNFSDALGVKTIKIQRQSDDSEDDRPSSQASKVNKRINRKSLDDKDRRQEDVTLSDIADLEGVVVNGNQKRQKMHKVQEQRPEHAILKTSLEPLHKVEQVFAVDRSKAHSKRNGMLPNVPCYFNTISCYGR